MTGIFINFCCECAAPGAASRGRTRSADHDRQYDAPVQQAQPFYHVHIPWTDETGLNQLRTLSVCRMGMRSMAQVSCKHMRFSESLAVINWRLHNHWIKCCRQQPMKPPHLSRAG